MDNEFGYGMKYYNDDDPALLRLEALKEAQDLWYETQDLGEETNLTADLTAIRGERKHYELSLNYPL